MKQRHRRKSRRYDPDMVAMKSFLWIGRHKQQFRMVCRASLVRKHKTYYISARRIV